ncbi:putative exported protein [Halobacteriovorax marinus SJ]|uniref:Exported protein n=1 Tax=Halobacteriovorax marinus (strain ATCC BAA-682 / DSM 15412 / SJ) TaxID=862908 RepID=E1X550_HALMS|nr:HEAT repeat domain-containing protein [Halobacteriovorax marinus]CBW25521.1 putative exported protein [Halobacteriovorax marinus SJ]
MKRFLLIALLSSSLSIHASVDAKATDKVITESLLKKFSKKSDKKDLVALKKEVLSHSGKSVPALIQVMKSGQYPEKNRWVATFMLGKVMGKKSAPFISKFLKHPSWVMRMASLKTLLALKGSEYKRDFSEALKDKSFIVRSQALDNISKLNLTSEAPFVWQMLYDKRNYYSPKGNNKKTANLKRTNLIKKAILTVGELKFQKAKAPLLSMIQKDKYKDIFNEMNTSLEKITGKKSPKGDKQVKTIFWKKIAIANKTI